MNKIEIRLHLKSGTPETMKLLGSTVKKIDENKNGESVSHLEIALKKISCRSRKWYYICHSL